MPGVGHSRGPPIVFGSGSNLPTFSKISCKLLQFTPPESSHPSSTTPGKQNTQHAIISLTAKVHVEPDVNNMTLSMESPSSADGGLHHKHQIATKEVITTDTSRNIQAYMGLVQIPILLPKKLLQLLSNLNPLPLLLPLGLLSRLWW